MAKILMPRLGEFWEEQGGVRAGEVRSVNGTPDYQLILPIGFDVPRLAWGGYGKDEPGAQCTFDGLANTRALVESEHDHPAAQWCAQFEQHGFGDFYLPARREWRQAWVNAAEHIEEGWYWTSTQFSPHGAYVQGFAYGTQSGVGKGLEARVRPVRRFIDLNI